MGPAALCLAATGQAAEPDDPPSLRSPTWDMTQAELEAIGLGQSRGDPVPPAFPQQLDAPPRPTAGGQPPPQIIFVNFDGAMLTQGGDNSTIDSSEIYGGEFLPYGAGDKRAAVMQATRADWVEYNIDVVEERPSSGNYTMNMTGPTNFMGPGVLGVAPLDCKNLSNPNNVTYAFHSADDMFDAATTATTIGQEVAHSYGLEHVDEPADILNPVNAGGDPSFIDECLPLSGGGAGSFCPEQHTEFCADGMGQNSHQELLAIFGPAIPDVTGPVVLITAPLSGTTFAEGESFNVIATITDDSQVTEANLYVNGQLVQADTSAPWGWQINNVPVGLFAIEVIATDEYENQGLSTPVSILVEGAEEADSEGDEGDSDGGSLDGGSGSDDGEETETAGANEDPKGCGCAQGGTGAPWLASMPLLLLMGLRRRRMIAPSIALGLSFTAGTARGEAPKPDELTSEPPRGTYVRVPDAKLVDPVGPQAGGAPPHILFLQRCAGGLELTPGADSSIDNTSTIPPGPATLPDYPFGNDSWQEVLTQTRDIFAPFNIDVTDEDPGTAPHDEAVVCGDGSEVGAGGAGGIAPFNCGIIPNAITFTFPGALGNNPRLLAEVVAQEAAHAWGLDHELLCEDPMTYLSGCGNKSFQDVDAECGEFDPRPCDCGIPTQNSYRHILDAFGPAIPDVDGPVVLITAPLSGTIFAEGEGFNVIATITDDSLLTEANLYVNGQLVQADTSAPWGWQINNVPTGLFAIEVIATDEYENQGLSTPVSILVEGAEAMDSEGDEGDPDGGSLDGGSGSDDGEETETAGANEDPKGCGCAQGGTGAPWLASMPLLLLMGLRRRRTGPSMPPRDHR